MPPPPRLSWQAQAPRGAFSPRTPKAARARSHWDLRVRAQVNAYLNEDPDHRRHFDSWAGRLGHPPSTQREHTPSALLEAYAEQYLDLPDAPLGPRLGRDAGSSTRATFSRWISFPPRRFWCDEPLACGRAPHHAPRLGLDPWLAGGRSPRHPPQVWLRGGAAAVLLRLTLPRLARPAAAWALPTLPRRRLPPLASYLPAAPAAHRRLPRATRRSRPPGLAGVVAPRGAYVAGARFLAARSPPLHAASL